LIFETGIGKFDTSDKIYGVDLSDFLKENFTPGKIYSISKKDKNFAIPLSAMGHDRLIVAVEASEISTRSRCVMKVFTKNASIALTNTIIYQDLKRQKQALEERIKQLESELSEALKLSGPGNT
jgi:hypothetical protein